MSDLQMKAIINRDASETLYKTGEDGKKRPYVLHTAEVTDGPLKGAVVTCSRTLVNTDGVEKKGVEVGQEVTLWMTIQEDERGRKPFFSIQSGATATADEDILAMLATANVADEAI